MSSAPTRHAAHSHVQPAHLRKKKPHLPAGMGNAPGGAIVDDEGDNSSRDASEEDNDDISGASDSASSLRTGMRSSTSTASVLPTSARDRALVDSNPRRPSASSGLANAIGDKTPGSTSPPRVAQATLGSSGAAAAAGGLPNAPRRPSGTAAREAAVSHTLERASAALSSSSGGSSAGANTAHEAIASRSAKMQRPASSSSAGSAGDGPENPALPSRSPLIDLAGLPPALPSSSGAIATPRAGDAAQRGTALAGGGRGDAGARLGAAPRPTDADNEDDDTTADTTAANEADGATASPYDGDVEFAAARTPQNAQPSQLHSTVGAHPAAHLSSGGTAPADVPSHAYAGAKEGLPRSAREATPHTDEPVPTASPEEIRAYIHKVIHEPDPARNYRINLPADGGRNSNRPVRIYADGVYDLFHYAHALQLRQAKLFFPSVHLIVGVVSSSVCAQHKNEPVLTSAERYASVRNCRWVDEVLEDAPWVIDQDLLDRLRVDYVAHDEALYPSKDGGNSDIYGFAKEQGRFLPTLRTPGVSTSELLGRIVEQYRCHTYDEKLAKIGLENLKFD